MTRKFTQRPAVVICGCAVLLLSLGACQGRRASNMEPTGETIECVIDSAPTDTASHPERMADDSTQNAEKAQDIK